MLLFLDYFTLSPVFRQRHRYNGGKKEKEKAASFRVSASIKVLSCLKTRQNNTLT